VIDDDYTLDEGDRMPDAWWRVADVVPLNVRYRSGQVPGLPPLAFGTEFHGRSLSVYGPRYLDLWEFTCWKPHVNATPQRRAFDALTDAYPDRFSTVVGGHLRRSRHDEMIELLRRLVALTSPDAAPGADED